MSQYGISQAKITLSIFEIDRIDLVRHCRTAHFASFDTLTEVVHRNISPYITAEIDKDGVHTSQAVKVCRQMVIVFDLSSQFLTLQTKTLFHKTFGKRTPIDIGISHPMGIEIACSTAEFARKRHIVERLKLLFKTVDKNHQFFAKSCGRSRLSVGVSQHRNVAPLICQSLDFFYKFAVCRSHRFEVGFTNHHRERRIVDILRSKSEMHQLARQRRAKLQTVKFLFDKIFHGFDVVVRCFFDILDPLCRFRTPIAVDIPEFFGHLGRQVGNA